MSNIVRGWPACCSALIAFALCALPLGAMAAPSPAKPVTGRVRGVVGADVTATKTVAGTFHVGGTITYTVTLTNSGPSPQGDNPDPEFIDFLPSALTLVDATATSGMATATVATNTVTWDGSLAALGGSVTITITATINPGTQGTTISNRGTIFFDASGNGVNESSALTDDPGVAGTEDPTEFVVASIAVTATKTVSGDFVTGGTVTYAIVISNSGNTASPDNAGDELTDVLPAALALVDATASSGTATATVATNTVTWSGSVPAAGSVTVTITATIREGYAQTTVANQGSVSYDSDFDGTNETTVLTDDPAVGGAADPTLFVVVGSVAEVPTVSEVGGLLLGLGLLLAAWFQLRRRVGARC